MVIERNGPHARAQSPIESGRVVIERCRPTIDGCELPAKAVLGLPVQISADIFADGFDLLLAWGRVTEGAEVPLELEPGSADRRSGWFTPMVAGLCHFEIIALRDEYGTWLHNLGLRADDGQDIGLELEEGALIAGRRTLLPGVVPADHAALIALSAALHDASSPGDRIARAGEPAVLDLMRRTADRSEATVAGPFGLWVDRERAGFSAWYELFPRSEGAIGNRSGTLATAALRLPGVAAMGFDIVYLPPIHPIGTTARRGRNNSDEVGPDDPGSPWAIGAATGGHTAIHPELGTFDDFAGFVAEAGRLGLEVALDYALQCSPEHPWATEHPEWFKHRPDGSVRYAENPPKRYFDIYPFDFDTANRRELWDALRDILLFWVGQGVRVFRVDNPHTKPFAFWQWLIAEVHGHDPGVIFLAEAFTRDAVRYRLSKVGFTQSYTDFTWRNSKGELTDYLTTLSSDDRPDWFRPNFWTNTPDILHPTLHGASAATFRMRMILAAITGPSWGMYSGYELIENQPAGPGSEEYLDSEKYEFRPRDWSNPASLAPLATALNEIRRRHREAIAQLRTLRVHPTDNERLLCVSRVSADRQDILLLVINLDPDAEQSGTTDLDLAALGLEDDAPFDVHDELTGTSREWRGPANQVVLGPASEVAHVLSIRRR